MRVLQRTRHAQNPDLHIPATDYMLTLDADSLLVAGYCERLVHVLEQPGNERMAVIQTPYSSYRGASTMLERIAGATTDLQHFQHQGKSAFDATFWVGANAIIRASALDDIVVVRTEDGPAGLARGAHLHTGPHGHRRHRIEYGSRRQGLESAQLSRAAEFQCHAVRLRVARRAAPALGQRRSDHPSQDQRDRAGSPCSRRAHAPGRDPSAPGLPRFHRVDDDRSDPDARAARGRSAHEPAPVRDRPALFRRDGTRPAGGWSPERSTSCGSSPSTWCSSRSTWRESSSRSSSR